MNWFPHSQELHPFFRCNTVTKLRQTLIAGIRSLRQGRSLPVPRGPVPRAAFFERAQRGNFQSEPSGRESQTGQQPTSGHVVPLAAIQLKAELEVDYFNRRNQPRLKLRGAWLVFTPCWWSSAGYLSSGSIGTESKTTWSSPYASSIQDTAITLHT